MREATKVKRPVRRRTTTATRRPVRKVRKLTKEQLQKKTEKQAEERKQMFRLINGIVTLVVSIWILMSL